MFDAIRTMMIVKKSVIFYTLLVIIILGNFYDTSYDKMYIGSS